MTSSLANRAFTFVFFFFALSPFANSQTPHWSAVAEHVSKDLGFFQQLFASANTEGLGLTILGDSQETTFGGAGRDYISALNHEFFLKYGNVPSTAIVPPSTFVHGWNLSSANQGSLSTSNSQGNLATSIATELPGVRISAFSNSPNIPHGSLSHVSKFGGVLPTATALSSPLFNGDEFSVELIARSRPGSSEIDWRVNANNDSGRAYFGGTDLGTGTTDLGLDRTELEYVTADLGTYNHADFNHLQVIAQGDSPTSSVDIVGARFINASDTSGVSVQSFASSGLRVSDFLENYPDGADLFNVVAEDGIVGLAFGANDGRSRTAEQFKSGLESLIERLRLWTDNPNLPFVILGDPDNALFNENSRENFDLFPGIAAEIALEYDNVLALNSRLLSSRLGWDVDDPNFNQFVADDLIHYSPEGAQTLARLQVESLLSISAVPEPSSIVIFGAVFCGLCTRRQKSS